MEHIFFVALLIKTSENDYIKVIEKVITLCYTLSMTMLISQEDGYVGKKKKHYTDGTL